MLEAPVPRPGDPIIVPKQKSCRKCGSLRLLDGGSWKRDTVCLNCGTRTRAAA
jgi:hypothetical protein